MPNKMNYSTFTKDQLVAECKTLKISGYSKKKKSELIDMLLSRTHQPPANSPTTETRQSTSATATTAQKKSSRKQSESTNYPKPILKWVGGKTQIIKQVIDNMPREMKNYREPFLGGGSVLLALLHSVRQGDIRVDGGIYAYDLNETLVHLYKNIQTKCEEVYTEIQRLIEEHSNCREGTLNRTPANIEEAMDLKENHYYWIRSQYNRLTKDELNSPLGSAMFVFMNKTGFRGVYREGPNGFNVPYGHYLNPEIINRQHLEEISALIQPVTFECCTFSESLNRCEPGDYVYMDPPYAPENDKSFVGYTLNGFSTESHRLLFDTIHRFTQTTDVMITMSNADVPLVRADFADEEKYKKVYIVCKRSINSKNPEATTREVIINNY